MPNLSCSDRPGGRSERGPAKAEGPLTATLYKNPRAAAARPTPTISVRTGSRSTVEPTHDLPLIKRQHGVPTPLEGCHTTLIEGYVVEGHVPVATILSC